MPLLAPYIKSVMRSGILSQSEHSYREPLQQSHQCCLPYWPYKRLVQNDVPESDKAVCPYRIFSTSFWREVWLTHWKITKEQSGSKAEQSQTCVLRFTWWLSVIASLKVFRVRTDIGSQIQDFFQTQGYQIGDQ